MKKMKTNLTKVFFYATVLASIFLIAGVGTVTSATRSSSTNTSSTGSSKGATNVIVDSALTALDSNLRKGDSGVLNLVIKNSGGYDAEKVEVWIPSTGKINIGKKFYVGTMESGESKTLPVMIRVEEDATPGLSAIQVRINYDGYDSDGDRDDDLYTSWEIPIRIYADPLFQISPQKTTYFKDSLDKLILSGTTKDSIKDLTATLSSPTDCLTVIGSSRKYISEAKSNETFIIEYEIKPAEEGACSVSLSLSYVDESGERTTDDITLGLNVEESNVDFKIVNVSYLTPSPGDTVKIKASLTNVGEDAADDVTITLSLSDPFVPVETTEVYLGKVIGGQTFDVEFNVAVSWDAEIKAYSLPLTISYKVGGTSYSVEKDIGVDVSGKIILEVIKVESTGNSVRIEVANIGTRAAEGVKATLVVGPGAQMMSAGTSQSSRSSRGGMMIPGMRMMRKETETQETGQVPSERQGIRNQTAGEPQYLVDYKSDIKANKETTFTFNAMVSGTATLILEYRGLNNQRVIQREQITLGRSSFSSSGMSSLRSRGSSTNITNYLLYAIIILVVVWIVYRKYKGKPLLPGFLAKKLGRFKKSE